MTTLRGTRVLLRDSPRMCDIGFPVLLERILLPGRRRALVRVDGTALKRCESVLPLPIESQETLLSRFAISLHSDEPPWSFRALALWGRTLALKGHSPLPVEGVVSPQNPKMLRQPLPPATPPRPKKANHEKPARFYRSTRTPDC